MTGRSNAPVRSEPASWFYRSVTEEQSCHNHDPADLVAALDESSLRVARLVASLRASWMRDALCVEFDVRLWFPSLGERNQPALDICGRCAVRAECLAEALADPDLDHGIRGGMTAKARANLRKLGAKASMGTTAAEADR